MGYPFSYGLVIMIELTGISKKFGHIQALREVSIRVRAGSIHGIIGENGAGKSTLMKILTGFIKKSAGRILLDGHEVELKTPRQAREAGIGMLYQEPLDFPRLSVLENFMAAAVDGNPGRQQKNLASLCARFGFTITPNARQESLTVGERQQVELMRLIRDECRILILDEPTTGISARQQELLFGALRQLRDQGAAILLVSHKLGEIHALCDRVSVLRQGSLAGEQEAPFDEEALLQAMFDTLPDPPARPEERPTGAPILTVEHLFVDSGRAGLRDVDLSVFEGEIVGLAGLDGQGQAVFLRVAAGLLTPDQGSLRTPLADEGPDRRVFLPADRLGEGLVAGLTIREHHLLADAPPFFIGSRTGRSETDQAIATYSILGTGQSKAEDLSGGNQQRLLLSLIPEQARLILLEQPTRGLDVQSGQWTWQHLRDHLPENGAIMFVSPDIEEIMAQSTRVLVFFGGHILLDRPVAATDYQEISQAITGRKPATQIPIS